MSQYKVSYESYNAVVVSTHDTYNELRERLRTMRIIEKFGKTREGYVWIIPKPSSNPTEVVRVLEQEVKAKESLIIHTQRGIVGESGELETETLQLIEELRKLPLVNTVGYGPQRYFVILPHEDLDAAQFPTFFSPRYGA